MKTLEQIIAHFPELPIQEAYNEYADFQLERIEFMFALGDISSDLYSAYCALWRNLRVVRLSTLHSEYEF